MKTSLGAEAEKTKFVAPDGGWGWVIVFASALSNIIVIPIMQSFGLLFKDRFVSMGMTATDCSVIINVNSAFGMGLGLLNGPLLRRFSYRKVALTGTILIFIGVTGTSRADTFADFLIMYSIITSLGIILTMSSFSLALNTYFKERRGKAAGIAMTATGFGPIIMPQLISLLMVHYGVSGTVAILGALSLHSFMAALLLQPVKWHMKPVKQKIEDNVDGLESCARESPMIAEVKPIRPRNRTFTNNSEIELDIDTKSMYGFETPLIEERRYSVTSESQTSRGRQRMGRRSISQIDETGIPTDECQSDKWWSPSLESIDSGCDKKILGDHVFTPLFHSNVEEFSQNDASKKKNNRIQFEDTEEVSQGEKIISLNRLPDEKSKVAPSKKKTNIFKRIGTRIVIFFDFGLLKDPIYVSLMLGSSLAQCAELNFSLFTPFIMADLGFSTRQIATIMSTIAVPDIIFRFLAPYVGDGLKQSPQTMYTFGLLLMAISRTTLIFFTEYHAVLAVSVFLGIAKGFRTTYMFLVIPSYVPLERLASASGIQMVSNGLLIMLLGPLLGVIRDRSGSYNACIIAVNCLTMITVTAWTIQLLVLRHRRKRHAIDNS